ASIAQPSVCQDSTPVRPAKAPLFMCSYAKTNIRSSYDESLPQKARGGPPVQLDRWAAAGRKNRLALAQGAEAGIRTGRAGVLEFVIVGLNFAPAAAGGSSGSEDGGGATFGISRSDGMASSFGCGRPLTSWSQPQPAFGPGKARSRSSRAAVRSRRCSTARFCTQLGSAPSEITTLSCCKIVPLANSNPASTLL